MRRRRFVPSVNILERRDLLATVFPQGFVGPIPADGVYAQGMVFPMPMPSPGEPHVTIQSMSATSIGGGINVSVMVPDEMYKFKSVKYVITGGAVENQVWTKDTGDYTVTTGTTHSWDGSANKPYQTSDSWNFAWDASTGARHLTVTATYNDTNGTEKSKDFDWDVQAPNVDWFRAYGKDSRFGNYDGGWGFFQSDQTYMQAQLISVPSSGQLGFVQLVNAYDKTVGTEKTTIVDFPDDKKILDWNKGQTPLLSDYTKSVSPDPNGMLISVGGYGTASDTPSLTGLKPSTLYTNVWKEFHRNAQFDVYLDWQPSGGIHVAIGHLHWSLVWDATYNGTLDAPIVYVTYDDQTKWTKTSNHPTTDSNGQPLPTWRSDGDTSVSILKWVMNSKTAINTYKTNN